MITKKGDRYRRQKKIFNICFASLVFLEKRSQQVQEEKKSENIKGKCFPEIKQQSF